MCLMHAELRAVDPKLDTGMDLKESYRAAKVMYTVRKNQTK